MKTLMIVLAALAVMAAFYNPAAGRAEDIAANYGAKTCSGQDTGPTTQLFFFGFTKEDGFCATRPFRANTYGEAKDCAVRICQDCDVVDITGRYKFESAVPGLNEMQSFCPSRR